MFGAERRQLILELVRAHGSVSVRDLALAVNASEVTVRRDVTTLEHRGLLERRHGGAMVPGHEDADEQLVLGDASTVPRTAMFGAERRRLIRSLVRANKAVSIADLARAVNVSEMTIRRDLDTLEKRGLIVRAHGGAVLPDDADAEDAFTRDPGLPAGEPGKAAIARAAAGLVRDGDAVMLGAGTTVAEFARQLPPEVRLTVLTNSVPAAKALAQRPGIDLVMTSGSVDAGSLAVVGSTAERWIAGHRVTRAFVSGTGLTAQRGLSSAHLAPAGVDRAMVASAEEVVVLADRSKLGVETTYQVAPVPRIAHLVTDAGDSPLVESLSSRGVRVHLAGGPPG